MIEVVEAGFGFVNEFTCNVCICQMTLYAGKLLVVGDLPAVVYMIHAVARTADQRTTGSMISADHYGHEDGANDDASGKEFLRGQADDVFPSHFRTPYNGWMSLE